MRVKMSKQPPPAPTVSAVGPCPTVIQIVGRPGTGSLPSTIAPPDHPLYLTCFMISSVDRARYEVSLAKDWVSVDCGTIIFDVNVAQLH